MPVLIFALGVPTTVAIGTDLFEIIVTASVGSFIHSLSNHVDLLMAVIMLAGASLGAQLGATATRFVEAGRIRILYGLTTLSGSLAIGLEQASKAGSGVEFLSTLASILLLSVSGGMCVIIAAGIPQIKPTFLDIAPSGIPSNIIPHSKGVKCGLIRSNSPFSYSNLRPAKPKIPKPLVYAQVSPLGTSFATP